MKPKVLIGIVSKNRASILPKAIQSGLDQDYPNKQIVVFDDHSTDNTRELQERFPEVSWIFSEEPKGYLYARNKLMREADAEYYCSLDDDAWFLKPDDLRAGVDYLESHPEAGGIAYDILSPEYPDERKLEEPRQVQSFIGCGHLLRLAYVREVGYYQPNPGSYGGEERDLSLQLYDRGYAIVKLPGVHIWHDITKLARDHQGQHRSVVYNDITLFFRRAPWFILVPGIFYKYFIHLKFAIGYKKADLLPATKKGLIDFARLIVKGGLTRDPVSLGSFYRFFYVLNKN
ncbi:MAG: glycosyltransferase [Imperialibacter sp.]|uniref:glycosyltransferase family 2 protein n=1 Tax=Imperialibacter sp. TaxID=2038411 RepID=UPI0032EEAE40